MIFSTFSSLHAIRLFRQKNYTFLLFIVNYYTKSSYFIFRLSVKASTGLHYQNYVVPVTRLCVVYIFIFSNRLLRRFICYTLYSYLFVSYLPLINHLQAYSHPFLKKFIFRLMCAFYICLNYYTLHTYCMSLCIIILYALSI